MRIIPIILLGVLAIPSSGQYDIGASGGSFEPYIRNMELEARDPVWSAAMFYRERSSDHTDLSFEMQLVHRRLFGSWTTEREGSTLNVNTTDLWLQHLYFTLLLDVRMVESGNVVVRFGPQFGAKLTESLTGRVTSITEVSPFAENVEDLQNATTDHFQHDSRFHVGLGFRVPLGTTLGIVIDPYFSAGISRMLKEDHSGRTNEVGLRIGLARRFYNRNITQRIASAFRGPQDEQAE